MSRYTIGIDSSTTATKAVLVDEGGRVVGVASSGYGVETPKALWSEQHPDLWWDATVAALRDLLAGTDVDAGEVAAVGLTGQMHGLVLLDGDDRPLRNALLWNDQRTAAECDEIRERVGRERLVAATGNDALTGLTAPKILWVRNHEPEIWERTTGILLPKDFVRLRLTGERATDVADGGGTLLIDLATRTWSDEVVAALEIPPSWLPDTFEGTAVTGTVTAAAAAATGLREGTPVVAGGGDQAAAAVGTGAVDPGVVSVSLGTSGVVFAATDGPRFDPAGAVHAFPHAVPGRWHMMGVTLAAAGSLTWFRDTVAPDAGYDTLVEAAGDAPVGAEGLIFLPYLSGERAPHADPYARGAFVGLTTRHARGHLTRAVLEGVAFSLRDALDVMTAAGNLSPDHVRITGGGAQSPLWRQIIADVLDATVDTVNADEGAAYGAALLAAVGAGLWPTVQEASAAWTTVTGSTPPSGDVAAYADLHRIYRSLYPALAPAMHALRST